MGRPRQGVLSTYPAQMVEHIKQLRQGHSGWGAQTLLVELEERYFYSPKELPSIDSVNRYLKQEGFVQAYEPHGILPRPKCPQAETAHELWEMDAQGAVKLAGLGWMATINIKDSLSKKYCMSFPVPVKHGRCQPATRHYQYACRLAFEESGMPIAIQVDKDSVFFENTTKSPFPTRYHLWLIALGIKLCIIEVSPPRKQAMVERAHQTIEKQALQGQSHECWKHLFRHCNERRERLNTRIPCRSLNKQAPLEAFPEAIHSNRAYSMKTEQGLISLERIYQYLAGGKWYRRVSKDRTVSLGAKVYYLKDAVPRSQVQVTFCAQSRQFIFRDVNERFLAERSPKGLSKEELIGASFKELNAMKYKLNHYRGFTL